MMKELIIILMLFPVYGECISSFSPSTLYVGGEGANNYTHIQDAIDSAMPGDTIVVYPGIYMENVVVNKSVILVAKGEHVVIDGSNGSCVVNITAPNCTLRGFEIVGYKTGVRINSNYVVVENNSVKCNSTGILLFNACRNVIYGNEFLNTSYAGISLKYSHNNIIKKNKLFDNRDNAICLWASNNNTICKNEVLNNGLGILIFSYSDNNSISYNDVYGNLGYGISVQGGSYNEIFGNDVYENGHGILIAKSWSRNNTIYGNNIMYNDYGVQVEGVKNIIQSNNISHNGVGVYLSGWLAKCERNVIMENILENDVNAYFYFRIFSFNIWYKNHWSDWHLRFPRPILGMAFLAGMAFLWVNFDFMPET